jgi:hypothetical protein
MHKDQKRLEEVTLPALTARIASDDPQSIQDCTVLNRLFNQGPDPLFLSLVSSADFAELCWTLHLSLRSGQEAIQRAHDQGPGALLVDKGFQPGAALGPMNTPEVLWLVLAGASNCTEAGYSEDVSMVERIRRAMAAVHRLRTIVAGGEELVAAAQTLREFESRTVFTTGPNGVPTTDRDEGFYVAFRAGHKIAAVKADGLTFYGTIPGTSLDAEGIKVDKKISDQFGIVFGT